MLRVWEPREPFVVLGHGSSADSEVRLSACRAARAPVLRRPSGGATVLQAPGCLNYALILTIASGLKDIAASNCEIMNRVKSALEPLVSAAIAIEGFTDLAIDGRKFSGNAQYRKKRALLFHGSILLDCDLALIQKLLFAPSRQPAYRQNREHEDFLTNLNLPAAEVKSAFREAWGAAEELANVPQDKITELVEQRYTRDEWIFRF